MRKLIYCTLFLLTALGVQAASPIKGLRIEGNGQPLAVYINGEQVCTASASCFVANLPSGLYQVEVYAVNPGRRGAPTSKGELLYNERVRYSGFSVQDIIVDAAPGIRPDRNDRGFYHDVMREDDFSRFYHLYKEKSFGNDRENMLESALATSHFTSDQCRLLASCYNFDNQRMKVMKMMYPKIVDKGTFFVVIEILDFSSSKTEMNNFVKNYR